MAIKENVLPLAQDSGSGYIRTVSSGGESQRTAFDTVKGAITADMDEAIANEADAREAADDQLQTEIDGKVDKVTGKGLSQNDFTNALKTKLDGIEAGAEVNIIETVKVNGTALVPDANRAVNVPSPTVDSALSTSSTNPVQNKVITGAVNDLKEELSDLKNYNFIEPSLEWTNGQVKTDGTLGTSSSYKHSKLIQVRPGELVEWQVNGGTSLGVSLYTSIDGNADVSNSMILEEGTVNHGFLTVPDGHYYVRLSTTTANVSDAYIRIYAKTELINDKTVDFFDGVGAKVGYIWQKGYIKNDGTEVSNSGYRYTHKISAKSGEKYSVTTRCSSSIFAVALYDANGIVLSKSTAGNDALTTYEITIPENIVSIAYTCAAIAINDFKILKKGVTISDIVPPTEIIDADGVNLLIKRYARFPFAEHRCATINFQFDDGDVNDADIVNIFKSRNAVCGFALISNIGIGRVEEYLGYQKDGFELLSHSSDSDGMSDATIPIATIEGKLKDSKKVLTGYGFNIRGWVTPRSVMASIFTPLIQKYYDFAYTTYFGEYDGTGTPYFTKTAELNKMSRVSVQNTTLANMKLAVDNTIANNGFLTFYGHSANLDTTDYETTENLEELLDYINTKQADLQCVLLAPSDAVDFYFHVRHEDYLELLNA